MLRIIKISITCCIGLLAGSAIFVNSASASDKKVDQLRGEIKQYKSLENKIKRHSKSLSSSQKSSLKSNLPSGLDDSDSDGVPDIVEHHVDGTNVCDGGSHDDGSEVEAQGSVASVSGSNFTLNTKSFIVSDLTVYRKGTVSDLIVGVCVEVKGQTISGSSDNTALLIKFEDSCN